MFAHRPLRRIRVSVSVLMILAAVLLCGTAAARPHPAEPSRGGPPLRGGPAPAAKAAGDTILLMGPQGSGAPYVGDFEDGAGQPAWNGWTSRDDSVDPDNAWHASTYRAVSGLRSAWCGEEIPSCGAGDPDGGYGNGWRAVLEWRGAVADAGLACQVDVSALANVDTEAGYDYCYLSVVTAAGRLDLWSLDGEAVALPIAGSHTYQPGDYVGAALDEVVVQFRVVSDGAWSDEDCSYPTAGAMQLDDVVIGLSNGTGANHDFEDGTLGPFVPLQPQGAGDFARIWTGLEDLDPCATNYTAQAAFIDDGTVVPGTGGAPCINWCYGPGGWIVNTTGGLAGPEAHLHNAILSPPMAWPDATRDAGLLAFDVYEHEDLSYDAPGMFWTWSVRSAAGGDPADLEAAPWRNDNFVHYGPGNYERRTVDVSGLLEPGRGQVQVRLAVYELGWVWGWNGDDGYPAPYFDNVRFAVFPPAGPALAADEHHLAQDAFPAAGTFDPADPGAASVRFDMARNVAPSGAPIVAGDSLVVEATVARQGATLVAAPQLHYRLQRNPVFDPWRTSGLPDAGSVPCDSILVGGALVVDRWAADLPDQGFLFPGDVLHYFFSAADDLGGDVRTATLPADTTGFSDFGEPGRYSPYDRRFVMRGLPTIDWPAGHPEYHRQPPLLLWFDSDEDDAWERWELVFAQLCYYLGVDVDVYSTRAAWAAAGNGLGAAATVDLLAGYEGILYTSGGLTHEVLGDGASPGEESPDLQLLGAWLDLGDKGLVAGGDNLASGVAHDAAGGDFFLSLRFGAQVLADDIRPLIANQVSPRVLGISGDPVFQQLTSFGLDGGCPTPRTFDAVSVTGAGVRAAEFAAPGGNAGYYPYAAAVRRSDGQSGSRTMLLPYAPMRVVADPWGGPDLYGRLAATILVRDAIDWTIGAYHVIGCISDVPGEAPPRPRFGATAHPNPFNPRVSIDYAVARPGHLTVTIYDLRGRHVRTLLDRPVAAGGTLTWDGTDARGAAAASGVYFYEVRMDNDVAVGKLALIR